MYETYPLHGQGPGRARPMPRICLIYGYIYAYICYPILSHIMIYYHRFSCIAIYYHILSYIII